MILKLKIDFVIELSVDHFFFLMRFVSQFGRPWSWIEIHVRYVSWNFVLNPNTIRTVTTTQRSERVPVNVTLLYWYFISRVPYFFFIFIGLCADLNAVLNLYLRPKIFIIVLIFDLNRKMTFKWGCRTDIACGFLLKIVTIIQAFCTIPSKWCLKLLSYNLSHCTHFSPDRVGTHSLDWKLRAMRLCSVCTAMGSLRLRWHWLNRTKRKSRRNASRLHCAGMHFTIGEHGEWNRIQNTALDLI